MSQKDIAKRSKEFHQEASKLFQRMSKTPLKVKPSYGHVPTKRRKVQEVPYYREGEL